MITWKKIFTTGNYAEAGIIQGMLKENDIPVQVLNKQDSSYPMFGDVQIYVPEQFAETARQLIDKALLN